MITTLKSKINNHVFTNVKLLFGTILSNETSNDIQNVPWDRIVYLTIIKGKHFTDKCGIQWSILVVYNTQKPTAHGGT